MPFTVNPTEAQAMQEDEAQLLLAILQATRSATSLLNQPQPPVAEQPETLRIQMGRRLVYGKLVHGEFRNELDADRMKAIFDAIQRPVTEGADRESYRGKIPAIEISDGKTVLFREERDGTITVNHIQFQLEQRTSQPSPQVSWNGKHPTEQDPVLETAVEEASVIAQEMDWKADDIAHAAEYLLNPLGDDTPMYDAVSMQGYHISRTGDSLKVTKDDALVLHASNGKILEHQINQCDWEVFQGAMIRSVSRNTQETSWFDREFQENPSPNQNGKASVHPAIMVAEREVARLPEGETKQLLTATVQDWKQQLSQSLQQGLSWLVSRPEAWRNLTIAHAALELFKRGYERTGEKSYQAGDYSVRLQGQNVYSLSDHRGELLTFKTTKALLRKQQIQVLSASDRLGESHCKQLKKMQLNALFMPHGSLEVETTYTVKMSRVEQTVKNFLLNYVGANIWDKEGGRFKLELGDNFLRITQTSKENVALSSSARMARSSPSYVPVTSNILSGWQPGCNKRKNCPLSNNQNQAQPFDRSHPHWK